ncbi:hypothetical protein [Delftia sp. PS-11]|uniref:hypothetical protein n=1 Tax=Delftia sp. PS-11 TaxID=2767222 RepID=UPI002454BE05|nr:hypothetical protein [Delftia sp. PS-11]KAJ8745969.1 hypothetical protein H9T68_04765 [Delftia sp. PS-11]
MSAAALQRLTTAYVEEEDRLRISGEDGEGRTQVLWLTQRLLGRLVPHLCGWLEQQAPVLEGDGAVHAPAAGESGLARQMAQGFAQQAAQAQLAAQAPEPVAASVAGWLVNGVDMHATAQGVHLVLRGGQAGQGGPEAAMALNAQALRQWLGIVHGQYVKAGWPLALWPAWMAQEAPLPGYGAGGAGVLH